MKGVGLFYAVVVISFLCVTEAIATNYTFSGTGNWTQVTKWDVYPTTNLSVGDTAYIQGICTIPQSTTIDNEGVIFIGEDFSLINEGSIDNDGDIIINGELFNDHSVINRNAMVVNGVLSTDVVSQFIHTENTTFTVNGSFENNSSFVKSTGVTKFNGNIVNNANMSILGVFERKSTASGLFVNNDYINMNADATIESDIHNSANGVFVINDSSFTRFSNDVDFLNDGELRVSGILHVGTGYFNCKTIMRVRNGGLLIMRKTVDSVL